MSEKKVSVNGGIAWREGAAKSDNPFDRERSPRSWRGWNSGWDEADQYFNGFANMQGRDKR